MFSCQDVSLDGRRLQSTFGKLLLFPCIKKKGWTNEPRAVLLRLAKDIRRQTPGSGEASKWHRQQTQGWVVNRRNGNDTRERSVPI